MKIAYIDCGSGIAGDMLLGAWLHAGVDLAWLQGQLSFLAPENVTLGQRKIKRHGIQATLAEVHVPDDSHHRHLSQVFAILDRGSFSEKIKEEARAVFRLIAEAEAEVHGTHPDKVAFHEVGALDAIADVAGTLLCVERLGIQKIVSSPVSVGCGTVQCAHGEMPVPVPAVVNLLKGVPVVSSGIATELVTPTGAALLVHLADSFGPMPAMRIETVAYGSGTKEIEKLPNVLRVLIGEAEAIPEFHPVSLIETNIDDMNPEIFGYVFERLFEAGALDVYTVPITMKKSRPATLLTVIAPPALEQAMAEIVLTETSSLGVRVSRADRYCLARESREVETPYGNVRVKLSAGPSPKAAPEYEDCRRLAREKKVPILEVYEAARRAVNG